MQERISRHKKPLPNIAWHETDEKPIIILDASALIQMCAYIDRKYKSGYRYLDMLPHLMPEYMKILVTDVFVWETCGQINDKQLHLGNERFNTFGPINNFLKQAAYINVKGKVTRPGQLPGFEIQETSAEEFSLYRKLAASTSTGDKINLRQMSKKIGHHDIGERVTAPHIRQIKQPGNVFYITADGQSSYLFEGLSTSAGYRTYFVMVENFIEACLDIDALRASMQIPESRISSSIGEFSGYMRMQERLIAKAKGKECGLDYLPAGWENIPLNSPAPSSVIQPDQHSQILPKQASPETPRH